MKPQVLLGKGVVGIEIPNGKSSVVFAREIIESPDWAESKDWRKGKVALPMLLGLDVSGNYMVGDLAGMLAPPEAPAGPPR